MSEEYTPIERLIIEKFRVLKQNKFGTMMIVKVHKGEVSDIDSEIDIRINLKTEQETLKVLQSA